MELQIEYLKPSELKPYSKNTRKHTKKDVEKIKRSIEKYGFNDPIGLWKDNIIIEGHGRLEAAKALGLEKVPVVRLDHLTDEQRREYAIAHNRTAEFSEWDMEMLGLELPDLEFDDFDLEFDFDFGEDEPEVKEDDYEIPEDLPTKAKLGDIWQLGRHRLMCGDSTDALNVNLLMGGV